MNKFTCANKHCRHEFYSSENKKVIQCPVCNKKVYILEKIITMDNFLYIESMIKNIETYGKNVLKMIDDCYPNPITRLRIRQAYFQTLEVLKEREE